MSKHKQYKADFKAEVALEEMDTGLNSAAKSNERILGL